MTLRKRNWYHSVVKSILVMCYDVPGGTVFTKGVHTTEAGAKTISSMCRGFASVNYEPLHNGTHTSGAQGFIFTVSPKG